ncbi:MAG TPA: GreA/GreB family elongation factor [Candidatus Tumulicola sp.]|nr:GreA/GreB family elongation factor [Candidatus Tumulicola sp.]
MSRAFVKDGDDRPERPVPRPVSAGPNYVTPAGLEQLREALAHARASNDERNAVYYEERIESAEVIESHPGPSGAIGFGSTVAVREANGALVRMRIVGEDEADPKRGTIAWNSPYARALMDHRRGDRVVVQRPAGPAAVVVESVDNA